METKTAINSLLAGADSFSFIMLVVKYIGRAEWLQGLTGLIPLLNYQVINWPSFYFLIVCITTSGLIFFNLDSLVSRLQTIRKNKIRQWDATDKNILDYIMDYSVYGETFPPDRKIQMANETFLEHVKSGRIKTAARRPGTAVLIYPKASEFTDLEFTLKTENHPRGKIYSFFAVRKTDKIPVFDAIICDRRQVEAAWPSKE